jgi:DNA-binding NarL/FixJ family response regulator
MLVHSKSESEPLASEMKIGAIVAEEGVTTLPRVFLADDQEEVLRMVASMLNDEFQIVGLAQDGSDVLKLVPGLSPDVLVLDILMPVMNGIETVEHLNASGSRTRVIFLTVHEDPDFLYAAMAAGAQAYVLKPRMATDLVPALRNVLAGHTFVSPSMHLH